MEGIHLDRFLPQPKKEEKKKKEMGGERFRRGECRGERVIMEAGIIIGVTKERGDPRKWGGSRDDNGAKER